MEWFKVEHVYSFVGGGSAECAQLLLLETAHLPNHGGVSLMSSVVDQLTSLFCAVGVLLVLTVRALSVTGTSWMSAVSQSIVVLLLATRCSNTSSLWFFEGCIEINFEFFRVAPWALLLVKHVKRYLYLCCSLAWWLSRSESFIDMPLDAFDVEGMPTVV